MMLLIAELLVYQSVKCYNTSDSSPSVD